MYPPPGKRAPREYFHRALLNFLNRRYEYANTGNAGLNCFMYNFILVKPGLHIIVSIAQDDCDRVLKRVSKLSTYRLQIFLVKYEYLRSLQLCEDQGICRKLKRPVHKRVLLRSSRVIWRPGFKFKSCSENVKQGIFQSE